MSTTPESQTQGQAPSTAPSTPASPTVHQRKPELTLEYLFGGTGIDLSGTRPKPEAKPRPKPSPAAPVTRPSPWIAEAIIWVTAATTCTCCGTHFQAPGATGPLLRFRHRRKPDTIHEIAGHPATANPHLPAESRIIATKVTACFQCRGISPRKVPALIPEEVPA